MREHSFTSPRRKTKIGMALAAGLGLLVVPTAIPASADSNVSAAAETDTTIAGTAFAGFTANDPAALLTFDSNIGVVLRKPEIAATEAQADARNTAGPEPTITCHEGVTTTAPAALASSKTVAGVGRYASEDGNLILYFYMEEVPTSAVDVCVMANSDYVSGASKFVFTAAGAKAAYGDPTALVEAAKAELTKVKDAAAKLYKKSRAFAPTNTLRTQLRKALNNQKIFIRASGHIVDSVNNAHLIREETTSSKLVASVRTADTRLVTMTYDARKKTTTFKVTPETFDSGAKAPASTASKQSEVSAQGISNPTAKYFVPGGTSLATNGAAVSGFGDNDVYVAVKTSNGTLSVPEASQKNLTLPFGYSKFSGSALAFVGKSAAVNSALATMQLTTPAAKYSPKDTSVKTTISITAFAYRRDLAYNPANQHFYKFIPGKISGDAALAAVASQKEFGLQGYLASITSAEENDFVSSKIEGARNVWIGASDLYREGVWKWVGGPDDGKQFWNGNCPTVDGSAFEGGFAKWATGEPNNDINFSKGEYCGGSAYNPSASAPGEDCVVTNWTGYATPEAERVGYWNDFPCSLTQAWNGTPDGIPIGGYVAEFGNKPVGGDYTGVDVTSVELVSAPPSPKVMAPNFFKKAATFTKSLLTPKPFKAPAFLKKKQPKVSAFVTVEAKLVAAEPGQYLVQVRRADMGNRFFLTYPGTSFKVEGAKLVTATDDRVFRRFTTTKMNQKVTIKLVLTRAVVEKFGPNAKNVVVAVELVNPAGWPGNMSALATQGTVVPVKIISK